MSTHSTEKKITFNINCELTFYCIMKLNILRHHFEFELYAFVYIIVERTDRFLDYS